MKACSSRDTNNPFHIVTLAPPHLDILPGQKAGDGSLLRPLHRVVRRIGAPDRARRRVGGRSDVLVIIGTSLVVYPAAGLVRYARRETPIFLIDPQEVDVPDGRKVHLIRAKASDGVAELREALRKC